MPTPWDGPRALPQRRPLPPGKADPGPSTSIGRRRRTRSRVRPVAGSSLGEVELGACVNLPGVSGGAAAVRRPPHRERHPLLVGYNRPVLRSPIYDGLRPQLAALEAKHCPPPWCGGLSLVRRTCHLPSGQVRIATRCVCQIDGASGSDGPDPLGAHYCWLPGLVARTSLPAPSTARGRLLSPSPSDRCRRRPKFGPPHWRRPKQIRRWTVADLLRTTPAAFGSVGRG